MRSLSILSLLIWSACNSDSYYGEESFPNEIDEFDASVADGGEPAETAVCMDEPVFNNNFSPSFGGEESVDVEVAHFSNFYCSHCADFASYTAGLWQDTPDFTNNVRIYFHHTSYYFRHRAAVAAFNQGEEYFWKLHDYIFGGLLVGAVLPDDEIFEFVRDNLQLDMEQFEEDLNSDRTYAFLKWDYEQALNAGVTGTPTAFVCGKKINSWTTLEDDIENAL
jgi:protein-disulfide isomerase